MCALHQMAGRQFARLVRAPSPPLLAGPDTRTATVLPRTAAKWTSTRMEITAEVAAMCVLKVASRKAVLAMLAMAVALAEWRGQECLQYAQVCSAGTCLAGLSCPAGYADCDGISANGCEIDINADPSNCGVCGNVCIAPNGTCTDGVCAAGKTQPPGNGGSGAAP